MMLRTVGSLRKRIFIILIALSCVIWIAFFAMIVDTKDVLQYVSDVFSGEIPTEQTAGTPLEPHNNYRYHCDGWAEHSSAFVLPLFSFHDGHQGDIWFLYSYSGRDWNGDTLYGTFLTLGHLEIQKNGSSWDILAMHEYPETP